MSRDVYDIFETTGFTELLDVKKALRKVSVEGLDAIGQRCGSFSLLRMATTLGMVKTDLSRTNKGEQQ